VKLKKPSSILRDSLVEKKARGAFFTPRSTADFLVSKTLYFHLQQVESKLEDSARIELLFSKLRPVQSRRKLLQHLENVRILDPAVGDGIFLETMADHLLVLHKQLDEDVDEEQIRKEIVLKNLFGLDRHFESVRDCKKRLERWITGGETKKSAKSFKIPNIKIGNCLIGFNPMDFIRHDFKPSLDVSVNEKFCEFLNSGLNLASIQVDQLNDLQPFHWDGSSKNDGFPPEFDIVIGNPPFGNILSPLEKQILKKNYQKNMTSGIAKVFVRRILDLVKTRATIGLVLPKSACFYSSWHHIRNILLDMKIHALSDVGLGFSGVDFEQIMLSFSTCPVNDNKVKIYRANKAHQSSTKTFHKIGEIPQSFFYHNQVFLFSLFTDLDRELIRQITRVSVKLKDLIRDTCRSIYVPDKEKAKLHSGSHVFINKVPDVGYFRLKRMQCVDLNMDKYKTRLKRILVPKIFLKVLRGRRLLAYPDPHGVLVPTEKLVCLFLTHSSEQRILAYLTLLNGLIPSYYLQKMVFSDTTETARVMDAYYTSGIPLLELSEIEEKIASNLAGWQLILNQSDQDAKLQDLGFSQDVLSFFSTISLIFSSGLYLKEHLGKLLTPFIEELKCIPKPPILSWLKKRWSCRLDDVYKQDILTLPITHLDVFIKDHSDLLHEKIARIKQNALIKHLFNYFSVA